MVSQITKFQILWKILHWVQQITVFSSLLCPAIYCAKRNNVFTLICYTHLFDFPLAHMLPPVGLLMFD
jgi:hypothetical protein